MLRFTSNFPTVVGLAPKVLLVEDDAATLKALTRVLIMCGYEVLSATTLTKAAAQLVWQPDFVLLDLMLPDGSGLDFLSRVRRHDESTLVAVISAGSDDLIAKALRLEPDALFRKPVDLPRLLEWLKDPSPRPLKPPVIAFRETGKVQPTQGWWR